jgi:hypothetical protein
LAAVAGGGSKGSTSQGLAFLALLSFITSFLVARAFATLNPQDVVVKGGIHFHHFWYGLGMIVVAGWLGIVYNRPRYDQIYAIVFGLGGGLVGDEIGLLLTFGDYNSWLTLFFFIIVVTVASFAILLRRRDSLQYDVIGLHHDERLLFVGIMVTGLSSLAFASGSFPVGLIIAAAGVLLTMVGFLWGKRRLAKPSK